MINFARLFCCIIAIYFYANNAYAAYAMKVAIAFPKGTAGDKPAAKFPTTTKISPCDSALFDALTFTATYDASNQKKQIDRDVYFILHYPDGKLAPRFIVLKKLGLGSGFNFVGKNSLGELSPTGDTYIYRAENLSANGAITETLGSTVTSAQAAGAGIWQLIGIVADGTSSTFSFDDPSSWDAWDVATIMLRKPWAGNIKTICE